jgi:hypothetical protein
MTPSYSRDRTDSDSTCPAWRDNVIHHAGTERRATNLTLSSLVVLCSPACGGWVALELPSHIHEYDVVVQGVSRHVQ